MTDSAGTVTLEITKVVYGGEALGFIDGKACFVEGALPGEKVRVRITADRKNHFKAQLVEVLEPSTHRVAPPCEYIGHCGGCQYQHVTYAEELRIKESQVRESFEHALKTPAERIRPIRATAAEYGYRNAVTLHRTARENRPQPLGFIGKDNATPSVIRRCLLVDERLSEIFQKEHALPFDRKRLSFKLNERGEILTDRKELYFPIKVAGRELLASSEGFFQSNLAVTELVAAQVKEWTQRFQPTTFVDLYAGVGTFTVLSADAVGRVICAEESRTSFECLRMNLKEHRKAKGPFKLLKGKVEDVFPLEYAKSKPENAVIFMDPPRQGLNADFARFLGQIEPPLALIYLSCDLATLTRDLKLITGSGRLRMEEIVPFDMFPRTRHIETVVLLVPAAPIPV